MLIMKLACGESAIKGDGIGDIHVAMLASDQYRVYCNSGTLPDGEDEAVFDELLDAVSYASDACFAITKAYIEDNPL